MNNPIDLSRLIDDHSLDRETLATYLFPANKYPTLALNRVLKGLSSLDETQIALLSKFSGVPIEVLFSGGWVMRSEDYTHIFRMGRYEAQLNTKTGITTLFHNGELKIRRVIHTGDIVLSDYINRLNSITKSFTDE